MSVLERAMEYTDAPTTQTATAAGQMICPHCDHLISANAARCEHCGWQPGHEGEAVEGKASDAFAVLLSAIPGLGHIYKGHTLLGLFIMFIGTPMAVVLSLLAATGTAGFAILLLPIYWIAVIFHVWGIEDRVGPPKKDEGEQY